MYRAAFALTVIGAVLLVVAIVLPLVFPMLFDSQINKKLIIKPSSEMAKNFINTPIPIYFQIWFFNITNAEDVIGGAKPILNEIGPYTYKQQRQKVNVQWNDDRGTVLFNPKKFFYFEPDLSYGPESHLVTTVDPVFLTLAYKTNADDILHAAKSFAQLWFLRFQNRPFMTHSVKELSFGGYDEPLLGQLYTLTKDPVHQMAKGGFFFPVNGTVGGEVEIFSGELGMSNYQHIFKYHGKTSLGFWKEERCNLINGTDGSQFSRPIEKSKPLFLFTAQLCRSIYAVYEKDVKLGPLSLNRFVLPHSLFDKSDENQCYCSSNFTCKAGMIDVSPCRKGAPIVISTPHFYQGNEEDQIAVDGLNPSKEQHETRLDIEPTTGVAMRVAKRIQLNMPLRRYGNLPLLSSVPEVIMPILWINESVEVPMDRVEKLYITLTLPLQVVTYGSWALLVAGILLVFIALMITLSTYRKNKALQKRRQQLSDKKSDGKNTALIEKKLYQVS